MQAILKVKPGEIDDRLLSVIKELMLKNVEIVIKKQTVELEEFDAALPLDEVIREFGEAGYSQEFISDLKVGLNTSEIYRDENKAFKG